MWVLYLIKGLLDKKHFYGHTSYYVYDSSDEKGCVSFSPFPTCSLKRLTSDVREAMTASREDMASFKLVCVLPSRPFINKAHSIGPQYLLIQVTKTDRTVVPINESAARKTIYFVVIMNQEKVLVELT